MRSFLPAPSTLRAGTTFQFPSSKTPNKKLLPMRYRLLLAAGLFAVQASAQGRGQRAMTFEDFAAVRNVGDPQVSPDGQWVLYSVRTTDLDANKRTTVTKVQAASGGPARQFPDAGTNVTDARWSPDGK